MVFNENHRELVILSSNLLSFTLKVKLLCELELFIGLGLQLTPHWPLISQNYHTNRLLEEHNMEHANLLNTLL